MNIRIALALVIATALPAQQTRTEVVKPSAKPAEDAKPNNDSVPDVYAIPARLERLVVLRFKYQADLLDGLTRMVAQQKIRNAVILSAAGSVRGYHIHQVSNRTFPSKNTFVKDPTAPADLISMNGYILNGKVHVTSPSPTPTTLSAAISNPEQRCSPSPS